MTVGPNNCVHLTVDMVREIHREALDQFGGLDGVREIALLESALAAPQASFDGRSLYSDAIDIAAAYLFYLCRNHPFLDGNKRTALGACLVFLRLNGFKTTPDRPPWEWEALTLAVAAGSLGRDETTDRLRDILKDFEALRQRRRAPRPQR